MKHPKQPIKQHRPLTYFSAFIAYNEIGDIMKSISIDCLFAVDFCINYVDIRLCTTILQVYCKNLRRHTAAAVLIAVLECASCVFPRYLSTFVLTAISFLVVFTVFCRMDVALLYSGLSLWTGLSLTFVMKFFKGVLPMDEVVITRSQFDKKRLIFAVLTLAGLTLLKLYFDKAGKRPKNACLEIVYKDKKVKLFALRDTGNMLKDPLSGRPVAVLSRDAAKKLGLSENSVMDAESKVRVIPIKSVGHTGILYAFVPKTAAVDGKKQNICIALDPKNGDFSGYDAIIPSNI